ncbi:cysteine desulfurase family protein [Faecalibaculum rodentium]|jgi:cysteine desulfurase|uniref:cysteine desulfurase family protein n=1 Tax=Faecalibaculum rodentium TaxID=1702221 RepID=UPI002490574D|nr:cysteine desulfurase family protein [Faecalibaculum rodentium]
MIYFDNASTTSVHPEVARVYGHLVSDLYGNPDSLHALGRRSGRLLEQARERIAASIGVQPQEILFTSGGSEANSLAVAGYALANRKRGRHIITTNVEHSSAAHAADWLESQGFDVQRLPVNADGSVTAQQVRDAMRPDTLLVSIMHVNNETGAMNPLREIADVVHAHPTAVFHADLVQSFGKEDIPWESLDLGSVSAHKLHGLKGSGFLYKRKNLKLQPLLFGGQQEQGMRGGTENAPADIVLAKTVRLALESQAKDRERITELNRMLQKELGALPGVKIQSPETASPFILNVSFAQITSEVLMNALDARGICVSARSTCESRSSNESEVLKAMGRPVSETTHAIRLSFSGQNTLEEGERFIEETKEILNQYGLPL